jgi:hypothetical protein
MRAGICEKKNVHCKGILTIASSRCRAAVHRDRIRIPFLAIREVTNASPILDLSIHAFAQGDTVSRSKSQAPAGTASALLHRVRYT